MTLPIEYGSTTMFQCAQCAPKTFSICSDAESESPPPLRYYIRTIFTGRFHNYFRLVFAGFQFSYCCYDCMLSSMDSGGIVKHRFSSTISCEKKSTFYLNKSSNVHSFRITGNAILSSAQFFFVTHSP